MSGGVIFYTAEDGAIWLVEQKTEQPEDKLAEVRLRMKQYLRELGV
ncbi:MAG: hypothetical protein ACSLFJ_08585 [Immundisolibacter sp.]